MEYLSSQWTDFHEIWYLSIFRKSINKVQVSLKYDKTNDYISWRPYIFVILSRSVLLGMRNIWDKNCIENQNTLYVRLGVNVKKYCRAAHATYHMRTSWCISKAINAHSEYIILLHFHCNNGCTNAPKCYLTCTLTALFYNFIHSFGTKV
jgi:hypothetical protein